MGNRQHQHSRLSLFIAPYCSHYSARSIFPTFPCAIQKFPVPQIAEAHHETWNGLGQGHGELRQMTRHLGILNGVYPFLTQILRESHLSILLLEPLPFVR